MKRTTGRSTLRGTPLRLVIVAGLLAMLTACTSGTTVKDRENMPRRTEPRREATAENGERVSNLPVRRTAAGSGQHVVFSQRVDLETRQVLLAVAEFQVTNDLGYNVFVGAQVVLADDPSSVTGREITDGNGENVTPGTHHGQQTKVGTYTTVDGDVGRKYINLVAWAAGSRAADGDALRVDRGYGRLSVLVW